MFVAKVTGSLVSTQKVEAMKGYKLLVVEPYRVDPEKRKQMYARVQEIFADELPYFPLFQTTNLYAVKKTVHNYRPNPNILNAISDFWNASEWWKE